VESKKRKPEISGLDEESILEYTKSRE
jgi:hypothetical protein